MKKTFNHQFHTFDSGLRLVTVPMPNTKAATVFVLVGTGSKYETKDISGISHFLEHMMFKGTAKRPGTLDIAKELESIGAEYNAFTHKEFTGYYAKSSAEKIDVIMDVVFDIFLNSKLDGKEIAVEKGVIVEELNMYKDNPARYVGTLFEKLLYGDQPAGWDIGGEAETVVKLERKNFVDYFNTHYIAKNTVVVVAGNVNPDDIKTKTEKYFGNIRNGEPVTKLPVKESQSGPKTLVHWKETDQAHFVLGLRAFNMFDERKYALSLTANILGGGMSSRLFSEVREKRGLAYYVSADTTLYTDSGYLEISAGVNKNKVHEALEVVMEELRKLKDKGVTPDELQRSKDQVKGSLSLFLEHSDNIANSYASSVLFENKVLTPEEKLDKINRVTVDEVSQIAKDIVNDNLNFALIGPFKDSEPFDKILKL
ncbi:MAG: insulinase family protein [Candidatus Yanofskybacteria bacterium]|nr:insulinase family protein [Candidatus Yanofskybacteria bacterium]